jgi:protocatechuate 3,4-dioxygenase beta subunit
VNLALWMVTFLLQLPAVPASPRTGTASVEGIIVRLGTNEPISGVDLELTEVSAATSAQAVPSGSAGSTPPPAPFTAKSGNDGRFAIRNLPSGTYKLVAARIGGQFVPFEYGQRGILGRGLNFPLGEGQQLRDVRLEMAPVGTITGRVVDENGRPVGHAAVLALSPMYREDQLVMNILELVHTDDRGEYRLFSLVPGKYYIATRPEDPTRRSATLSMAPPGRRGPSEQATSPVVTKRILPTGETIEETHSFVYYGGTTDLKRATPLNVMPGNTLGAIDIPIHVGRTTALHVRGKVIDGTTGNPAAGANVRLIPRVFNTHMIVPNTVTDANGLFDVTGVVPGSYNVYFLGAQVLQRPSAPGVPPPAPPIPLMTMAQVEVGNENIENINVTIAPGSTITGQIIVEGAQSATAGSMRTFLGFEPVPTGVAMVSTQSTAAAGDGKFKIENLWPANYRIRVNPNTSNVYVKSIRLGRLDLLNQPLTVPVQMEGHVEIVLASDHGVIEGRVVNERQDPAVNVKVALVPDAPLRSRGDLYKSTTTDITGAYRIPVVPPGDYKIFAWEEAEDGAWRDPEFLRSDETRGKSLRLGALRTESATLTVIPARR